MPQNKNQLLHVERLIDVQQGVILFYMERNHSKLYDKKLGGRRMGFSPTPQLQIFQAELKRLENEKANLLKSNQFAQLDLFET